VSGLRNVCIVQLKVLGPKADHRKHEKMQLRGEKR